MSAAVPLYFTEDPHTTTAMHDDEYPTPTKRESFSTNYHVHASVYRSGVPTNDISNQQ